MSVVAVIGLGYVGLPLAVAFGRYGPTIGFDLAAEKVAQLRGHVDPAGEVAREGIAAATDLRFTSEAAYLAQADIIIIAVPTPVDQANTPDLGALEAASRSAGTHMKAGALVVFESTVYPGCTEEVCVPILEAASGLTWKQDFHVAYSPERINPGDRHHTLLNTVKVVAGDSPETLARAAALYGQVVETELHLASSIKVAEASKVIENTQRDLNIALMNELAIIFEHLEIDTAEVLKAAGTKWNFLPFFPGLVGGHCIGVDPYYLTYKAGLLGYHPQVVLAGRRINDGMGKFIAEQTVKQMVRAGSTLKGAKVNLLGLSFKEDVADVRNSKVIDVVRELRSYHIDVAVHDPLVPPAAAESEYDLVLTAWEDLPEADALVVAVAHRDFLERPLSGHLEKLKAGGCFIDIRSAFDAEAIRATGRSVWRL
jgi:UDP-N-acetyl-D-galactosamine dehydrogenase